MTVFIIRRLMQSLLVLAAMTVIVFVGVYAIGNPIDILIAPDATQEERARAIASLGLDRPLWEQYAVYIGNMLQGDLGKSFVFNEPALQLVLQRLPATLELAVAAMLIAICIGIPPRPLGRAGAGVDRRPVDHGGLDPGVLPAELLAGADADHDLRGLSSAGCLPAGRGDPGTFLGMESTLFSVDGWSHLILPATNLALFKTSLVIRLTRAGVRETLPLDYVRFARAKGLSRRRVIFVHVLRNILIPLVTILGLELGTVIAFAVVTETIFAWPGIGKLIIDSIFLLDRPVIVAYLIVIVLMFITINLIVDVLYSILDPRVRLADLEG